MSTQTQNTSPDNGQVGQLLYQAGLKVMNAYGVQEYAKLPGTFEVGLREGKIYLFLPKLGDIYLLPDGTVWVNARSPLPEELAQLADLFEQLAARLNSAAAPAMIDRLNKFNVLLMAYGRD